MKILFRGTASPTLAGLGLAFLLLPPAQHEMLQRPHLKRDRTQSIVYPRIIQHEDERSADDYLMDMLSFPHLGVRKHAIIALGRIGYPSAVASLHAILKSSPDPDVRALAAFSLGQIASQYSVSPLLERMEAPDEDVEVRARAVEALGKIGSNKDARESLGKYGVSGVADSIGHALPDPSKAVGKNEEEIASMALTALLRIKDPSTVPAITNQLRSPSPDLRWRAANALGRIGQNLAPAVPQLVSLLSDKEPLVRAHAAKTLGIARDPRAVQPLITLVSDGDQKVVAEAVRSLGSIGDHESVEPLISLGEKQFAGYHSYDKSKGVPPQQNLLLLTATALGDIRDPRALQFLKQLRFADGAVGWAPETEVAGAQFGEDAFFDIPKSVRQPAGNWQATAAFAQGLGYINTDRARSTLLGLLSGDVAGPTDALAVPEILKSLANLKTPALKTILLDQLKANDVIVRATAASLLGTLGDSSDAVMDALQAALKAAHSDKANDAKVAIVEAANKLGHPFNIEVLSGSLKDDDYVVRRLAAELIRQSGIAVNLSKVEVGTAKTSHDAAYWKKMAALMDSEQEPTAIIHTAKGDVVIQLFASDAPMTVDNFEQLAKRGFFNGLAFERVVPDFVIQGGDPRGDLHGGPGYQIRDEINMHPYVAGTLGMALHGKDTGGSQFFITHTPQPHLDGGYTAFGQVIKGMEIIDQIARGDVIQSVEIVERKP
ncbi:MAG: HEAT repeat domain-containing protein [Blastocatellia bacterium]